jgi:hypothetical protein
MLNFQNTELCPVKLFKNSIVVWAVFLWSEVIFFPSLIDVIIAKLEMNTETHTELHVNCLFYLSEFNSNLKRIDSFSQSYAASDLTKIVQRFLNPCIYTDGRTDGGRKRL